MMNNRKTPAMMASEEYAKIIAAEPNAPAIRFYDDGSGSTMIIEMKDNGEQYQMTLQHFASAMAYHRCTKLDIGKAIWRENNMVATRENTPWELWNGVFERYGDDDIRISIDGERWAKIAYDNYQYMTWRVSTSYKEFQAHRANNYTTYMDEATYYITKYASGPLDDDRVKRLASLGLSPWKKNGFNRLYLNSGLEGITAFIDASDGMITVHGGNAEQRKKITIALENALIASRNDDATQRAIRAMGMMQ